MSNTNTLSIDTLTGTPAQKRAALAVFMAEGAYLRAVDFGTNEQVVAALMRLNEAADEVRKAHRCMA